MLGLRLSLSRALFSGSLIVAGSLSAQPELLPPRISGNDVILDWSPVSGRVVVGWLDAPGSPATWTGTVTTAQSTVLTNAAAGTYGLFQLGR